MSTQIGDLLNDFRSAIDKSQQQSREYNKTSKYIYKPNEARYKLVIWFKDGNKRVYYSYDHQYHNKEKHIDEHTSLMKLLKLMGKHMGAFKNAIIYATEDPERKVTSKYTYIIASTNILGHTTKNKAVRFVVVNKDNLLNLKHLELYSVNEKPN